MVNINVVYEKRWVLFEERKFSMEFFIDTADVEAIRKAYAMGFISGVTTKSVACC